MSPAFARLNAIVVVLLVAGLFAIFMGGVAAFSNPDASEHLTWTTIGYLLIGFGGVCLIVALVIHAIKVAARGVVDALRTGEAPPTTGTSLPVGLPPGS